MPPVATCCYPAWCLALCLLGQVAAAQAADDCHPPPDPGKNQYLVGYGSLMNEASKRKTAPNVGDNLPVRVSGFSRHWGLHDTGPGFGTTYLVAGREPRGRMNAVIFHLPEAGQLDDYDRREAGYCRAPVPDAAIEMAGFDDKPQAQFWIYVRQRPEPEAPSRRHPLTQSYVDVFLGGCLELEQRHQLQDFAAECVTTTHGWSAHWVNDRLLPRRPLQHQPLAFRIDRLLHSQLPRLYPDRVRIE